VDEECTENLSINAIIAYWCNYFAGSVHAFRMLDNNSQRSQIIDDLKKVNSDLEFDEQINIEVIVITWFKMESSGANPDSTVFTVSINLPSFKKC